MGLAVYPNPNFLVQMTIDHTHYKTIPKDKNIDNFTEKQKAVGWEKKRKAFLSQSDENFLKALKANMWKVVIMLRIEGCFISVNSSQAFVG